MPGAGERADRRSTATALSPASTSPPHQIELERLPSHASAIAALQAFPALDRYLAGLGVEPAGLRGPLRAREALKALLVEVFDEQTDFALRPERLSAALGRLERAALSGGTAVTLVTSLHGVAITNPELVLARGLTIARPEALDGLPPAVLADERGGTGHLVAALASEEEDPVAAIAAGRAVLCELLRALRLFGDGRVALGALAWCRVGTGAWTPLVLGAGGSPRGVLLVTADQEDELRAFCNLVSRRAPHANELAWALRRFELGCERESRYEGLSDHLLALRALLEPEDPPAGMLPGRLAALCATPERRVHLAQRVLDALALERQIVAGTAVEHAGGELLAAEIADHVRALLRDVICGHLDPDLAALADEILREPTIEEAAAQPVEPDPWGSSAEEMFRDAGEAQEILDLSV